MLRVRSGGAPGIPDRVRVISLGGPVQLISHGSAEHLLEYLKSDDLVVAPKPDTSDYEMRI